MSKLYSHYQVDGSNEEWKPVHTNVLNLEVTRPALVTILACDRIITKDSPKDIVAEAKYWGPMYFDLDNEDDLEGCIQDAQTLVEKLRTEYDVTKGVEIYLSGKKGIHVIIDTKVFIEGKVVPVPRLFAIYKEMAFKLATPSTDFAVYSGRAGRMFRTCYKQRDNGKWRVRVTAEQLKTLTVQGYAELCNTFNPGTPDPNIEYCPKLALLYETIAQKIAGQKKIKSKPVDAQTLRRDKPTVERLMKGEGVKEGVGFNKIAIQLGLYAHEAKLTKEQFVEACSGLIANHQSDSYRYNTARKRKAELARMFDYLEDGVGYDYSIGPIKAMLEEVKTENGEEFFSDSEEFVEDASGLFTRGTNYYVTTEQGEKHILDAVFTNTVVLRTPENEQIACISTTIERGHKKTPCILERSDLGSSLTLHRVVSSYGSAFTGTDIHARNIFSHMLREAESKGSIAYATDREGLDVLRMPHSTVEELRDPFIVWADRYGVRLPKYIQDKGVEIRFIGYPAPEGIMKTDIALAPSFPAWIKEDPENINTLRTTVRGMLKCQDPAILGKMLGWMVACYYKQLFHAVYGKFPLMHVNGAAGSGKSEMTKAMMYLFYYKGEPTILSPSSTNFAITSAISSSASVPVIVDEYKPHVMAKQTVDSLRSIFRSAYNSHTISRGGGSRTNDKFGALNQTTLAGPVAFIAEAIEDETAILERSVLVSLRRPFGRLVARYAPAWFAFKDGASTLSIIGQTFAGAIASNYSVQGLKEDFDPLLKESMDTFTIKPEDYENLSAKEIAHKEQGKPRVIYNHTVAKFGLIKLKEVVCAMMPENKEEWEELFTPLISEVFSRMDDVNDNTMAEYLKVFMQLSDMSRAPEDDVNRLSHGHDFEFQSIGDKTTINVVARLVYLKYRRLCRTTGANPLFPSEQAFHHALKDSNVFIRMEKGTKGVSQESVVLDYDGLLRLGVPPFNR